MSTPRARFSWAAKRFVGTAILIAAALALPASLHAEAKSRDKVFVPPVQGKGIDPAALDTLFDLVSVAVSRADLMDVVTITDVQDQLAQEKRKDALGCSSVSCATELAGALGVRYLLAVRVRKLGGNLMVTTSFIDTVEQKSKQGQAECPNREEEYRKAVEAAVAEALGLVKHSLAAQADSPSPSVPFYIEPKIPLEVTSGDRVDLPVSLINATTNDLPKMTLKTTVDTGIAVTGGDEKVFVKANSRKRKLVALDTTGYVGLSDLIVDASDGNYADKVTKNLVVRPLGFPVEESQGGLLEPDSVAHLTIEIPKEIVVGSSTSTIAAFPTPLGNLTQALTSLMREPSGCFEQTSSTTYPLTMAGQYFTTHAGVDPKIVKDSGEMLTKGYQRLVGFECQKHGYEWFGGTSPGHEALTAYGLMEFADMKKAKLRLLDATMVERTRAWLLSRRDGKGGFLRNPEALDSFGGAPEPTTNAYIVWALVQAGEPGLDKEVAAVKSAASISQDSYIVALAANVAASTGDKAAASALLTKLKGKQDKTGVVTGATTSITQSNGEGLAIETTSLALLAWLTDNSFAPQAEQAFHFLASACQGGRFASTQATVLALKAIVAYDTTRARAKAGGSIQLMVDGIRIGDPVAFTEQTQGAISLPSIAEHMTAGKHFVDLKMRAGSRMPFTLAVRYHALTPASSDATRLTLATSLPASKVKEGDTADIRVEVANATDKDVPMPVAIVGVPGGVEVRFDQLRSWSNRARSMPTEFAAARSFSIGAR